MKTVADILAAGLGMSGVNLCAYELPVGTHCVVTGQAIRSGYRVADLVTQATAEFLDCFRGGLDGYVSDAVARCWKSVDSRLGNPTARSVLAFERGPFWNPLIARETAAKQGRPYWSDLVRQIWPERQWQRVLCILTTDTKKRLWIRARVGPLGATTPVLCYDSETAMNEVRFLNWPELITCLDLVETVYSLGFVKEAIRQSLYVASKAVQAVGLSQARAWEKELALWRNRPEFLPAVLIAQKKAERKA